jgi:hypothetical protein
MTDRIRVGTAGVLLPYRSPLKVASDFLPATLFHQVGHCLLHTKHQNLQGPMKNRKTAKVKARDGGTKRLSVGKETLRDLDAKAPDLKGGVRASLQVTGAHAGGGRTIACASRRPWTVAAG